jgi:hypothetical protein
VISTRYAWAAAAVLLVAAAPTWLNLARRPAEPAPGALEAELGDLGQCEPGRRKAETTLETFAARDFATRQYGAIELFAARTYDGKKLFHFPELALTYGRAATAARDVEGARVIEFAEPRGVRVAAYALLYGKRPVAQPIRFYLSILPELFIGRREPMTLVYVQGDAEKGGEKALEQELRALLGRAVDALQRE